MHRTVFLVFFCAACGRESPYPDAVDPVAAPTVAVDRFGDGYATMFKRSDPVFNPSVLADIIPGPNEPIDYDADFTVKSLGPDGQKVVYYALDIAPHTPARAFVVLDGNGAPIPEQLPVLEKIPGDEGYNDFVLLSEVFTGDRYEANQLTSAVAIEDAAAKGTVVVRSTTHVANWPVVPAGTSATKSFDGAPVSGFRAWRNGEIVHHLQFETALPLTQDDRVPTAYVTVIFENGMDPSEGFAAEPDGQTHNVFDTVPGDEYYSSYWKHNVGKRDGFDSVHDWASAQENLEGAIDVIVNCPIVE